MLQLCSVICCQLPDPTLAYTTPGSKFHQVTASIQGKFKKELQVEIVKAIWVNRSTRSTLRWNFTLLHISRIPCLTGDNQPLII